MATISDPLEQERSWWGHCANTFHEEQKQLVYASRMGLLADWGGAHPPTFDMGDRSVVDIGGGPVSLLLKAARLNEARVVDPVDYPDWVVQRYTHCGIDYQRTRGEDFTEAAAFDEAWIYNVLQHVEDPELVCAHALEAGIVRVFEWIEIEAYDMHPHCLHEHELNGWLGGRGFVAHIHEDGAHGLAYYGVFTGG